MKMIRVKPSIRGVHGPWTQTEAEHFRVLAGVTFDPIDSCQVIFGVFCMGARPVVVVPTAWIAKWCGLKGFTAAQMCDEIGLRCDGSGPIVARAIVGGAEDERAVILIERVLARRMFNLIAPGIVTLRAIEPPACAGEIARRLGITKVDMPEMGAGVGAGGEVIA